MSLAIKDVDILVESIIDVRSLREDLTVSGNG